MKNKFFLIIIIVIAFALRFYNLGSYPALNADEAALGYNAYSLLETGKDEHGNFWPIHFQSFNDYKPGFYVYLVMPFISLFGLNEWSVRLPGASAGVGTVIVIYLLAKQIVLNAKKFSIFNFQFSIPEFAAFLLAINPWHIHFSRGAWEVNVATFFITCGLWLFLKFLTTSVILGNTRAYINWYLVFSFLSFVFSLYTYHAARIIVPLLAFGILFLYWKELLRKWKTILLPLVFSFCLLVPLVIDLLGSAGISRAAGVGLFADPGPLSRIEEQRGEHTQFEGFIAKVLHNKPFNYALAFVQNWTDHFHGEFLFLSGDEIQRSKVPEIGQMHIFEIVTIGLGIWFIISNFQFPIFNQNDVRNKGSNRQGWLLIMWWLLVSPSASALTFQSPHALRAQNMVIPLTIVSAFGLYVLIRSIDAHAKKLSVVSYGLLVFVIVLSLFRYIHMYYVHMSKEYPFSSQYGLKELVSYVNTVEDKYEKIIITDRYDQPYILFLFFKKYDPKVFQGEHQLSSKDVYGFSTVRSFNKYYFEPITAATIPENPRSLIIGTDENILPEANIVQKIYGTNGHLYFEAVAN